MRTLTLAGIATPMQTTVGHYARAALRAFPWPIRKKILTAPPLVSEEPDSRFALCVLATRKTELDAIWSAYSFCYMANMTPLIHFVVDPFPGSDFELNLRKLFPSCQVHACADFRKAPLTPEVNRFCRSFRFGGKLAAILQLKSDINLLYFDSDVMFFQMPNLALQYIDNDVGFYLTGGGGLEWNCPVLLKYMESKSIQPITGFNSGMMFFPSSTNHEQLFEDALSVFDYDYYDYFTEQTLFNLYFSLSRASALPSNAYYCDGKTNCLIQSDVDYKNLIVRHFTGPFRHQLYLRGMPLLAAKFRPGRQSDEDRA